MVGRWIGTSFPTNRLCSSNLPCLGVGGRVGDRCVSIDSYKKGRVFTASVSATKRYRSNRGELLLSFNKEIFETRLLFLFGGLGEEQVVSQIFGTIL